MAEPTLLQQARLRVDMARGSSGGSDAQLGHLGIAVDRILQHLEQHEAAMSGPAQVPGEPKCKVCGEPRSDRAHRFHADRIDHDFEPADAAPLVSPDEAAHIDERLRAHFDRALQKTADMAAKLDAEARSRALRHARGEEGCESFTAGVPAALDLDELQRLCDAATPGPWEVSLLTVVARGGTLKQLEVDAQFVDAARDALPKLIARVRQLESRIATVNNLGNEFASDPATALRCIGEHLDLAEHYDRHPNAPRDEHA